MNKDDIFFRVEKGIATITLNQPEKKNAFNMGMIERWSQALVEWRSDPEVKVIVLTGAGDAFCSGVDLGKNTDRQSQGPYEHKSMLWDKIHRIAFALEDLDKPVIAAVNGVAVGAGLDMALMCDIRFAADTARLAEGYVKVGLVPGDGGCYFLPRLVGVAKALELFFTGEFIDAQGSPAHRHGQPGLSGRSTDGRDLSIRQEDCRRPQRDHSNHQAGHLPEQPHGFEDRSGSDFLPHGGHPVHQGPPGDHEGGAGKIEIKAAALVRNSLIGEGIGAMGILVRCGFAPKFLNESIR